MSDSDKLIIDNIPLINYMIKELHCRCKTDYQYQRYYDYGLDGLIKGARSYNESKGKTSTYLCMCIKNEILKCFYLDSMPKRCNSAGTDISLNQKLFGDNMNNYTEYGELIPDPNINIEDEIERKIQIETIIEAINNLDNEKDKLAIKMYYGLDGYEKSETYETIGKKLGVTREMIRHRIERAKRNIKENYKKNDRDILSNKKEKK